MCVRCCDTSPTTHYGLTVIRRLGSCQPHTYTYTNTLTHTHTLRPKTRTKYTHKFRHLHRFLQLLTSPSLHPLWLSPAGLRHIYSTNTREDPHLTHTHTHTHAGLCKLIHTSIHVNKYTYSDRHLQLEACVGDVDLWLVYFHCSMCVCFSSLMSVIAGLPLTGCNHTHSWSKQRKIKKWCTRACQCEWVFNKSEHKFPIGDSSYIHSCTDLKRNVLTF